MKTIEERLCHLLLTQCLNGCLVSDSSTNTAYINVVSPKWDWLQCAEDIKIIFFFYMLTKLTRTDLLLCDTKTKNVGTAEQQEAGKQGR